jgi:putative phosphonate metabolism protein
MASEATQPHRVAVYFAPRPQSVWWQAASRWLGRCAATGAVFDAPEVPGVPPDALRALTADPRRYGFHATLKPPFRLQHGVGLGDVLQAIDRLCEGTAPFTLPPLRVAMLGDFLALRPEGDNRRADAVAASCVTALQPLASPLSTDELARRRQQPLTPEQDDLLQRWGYPWVLQQFRFHLSLTGGLKACSEAQRAALAHAAEAVFHPLPDYRFDSIAVFVEPSPGADFVLAEHRALRG